jgi:hypothetical protein
MRGRRKIALNLARGGNELRLLPMRLRRQHIFQTLFVPGRDAEAREAGEGKRTLRLHATRSENDRTNVPQCLIGIEAGMATHYVARELDHHPTAQQLSINSGWYEPVATADGVEPNLSCPAALRCWRCESRHCGTSSETLRCNNQGCGKDRPLLHLPIM